MNHFLSSLCPNLLLLDREIVPAGSRDFARTADGRVMLAHARSTLSEEQRLELNLVAANDVSDVQIPPPSIPPSNFSSLSNSPMKPLNCRQKDA